MIVKIDKNNPVKVIDQYGFVLLDYKPTTQLENATFEEVDKYLEDSVTY